MKDKLDWTYQIKELEHAITNHQESFDNAMRWASEHVAAAKRTKKEIKALKKQREILFNLQVNQ